MNLFLTKSCSKIQFVYFRENEVSRIHQFHCFEGSGTILEAKFSDSPPKGGREDSQNCFRLLLQSI